MQLNNSGSGLGTWRGHFPSRYHSEADTQLIKFSDGHPGLDLDWPMVTGVV